jgi:hypothetical protein
MDNKNLFLTNELKDRGDFAVMMSVRPLQRLEPPGFS